MNKAARFLITIAVGLICILIARYIVSELIGSDNEVRVALLSGVAGMGGAYLSNWILKSRRPDDS